ncbi:hypothetical protein LCM11_07385 [Halobacillus halophilus]|nr:hypothetical protein [Halobacillus halophilus]
MLTKVSKSSLQQTLAYLKYSTLRINRVICNSRRARSLSGCSIGLSIDMTIKSKLEE